MEMALVVSARVRWSASLIERSLANDGSLLEADDSALHALTDFQNEYPITVSIDATVDKIVQNIVDQLESHGKTWKAYMQSFSLCSTPFDHACGNQLYERKHNPFISYEDVQTNPARVANIVDFSQFTTDLANGTVPDYSWISPDQCHDMHGRAATPADPCDFSQVQALISTGDAFVMNTVNAIMNSSAWTATQSSSLFGMKVTSPEPDFRGSVTTPAAVTPRLAKVEAVWSC